MVLCPVHRKRENEEKLLIQAIGCSCCPSPFVTEDDHSVVRMFVLIRQSTNSSCNATVVISVDGHFVVVYCVCIICDCKLSTLIRNYRCADACVRASAHAVVAIFSVWNCGSVPVGFAQLVCPHVTSLQLQNTFSLNVMIGSFIKMSSFFILFKIRQQLFALYLKTCMCFWIHFFRYIYLREEYLEWNVHFYAQYTFCVSVAVLTRIVLMWRIGWAHNNARK